jgi:pSer/pThr/pTyr-binding forkhead associated (FHA) protein
MVARVRVEPPDAESFERELNAQEVVLGRGSAAGLVVPDSSVSRQHARLFQRDGKWWVEDLGATNGTLLNDRALKTPTLLGVGDTLKLGATLVHFLAPIPGATTGPTGGMAYAPTGESPLIPEARRKRRTRRRHRGRAKDHRGAESGPVANACCGSGRA